MVTSCKHNFMMLTYITLYYINVIILLLLLGMYAMYSKFLTYIYGRCMHKWNATYTVTVTFIYPVLLGNT